MLIPFALRDPRGALLHGLLRRPLGRRVPVVLFSPGGVGAGRAFAAGELAGQLCAAGIAVVAYNAAGRKGGRADLRSGGQGDLNGPVDQDGFAAVLRWVAARPWAGEVGAYSVSYGLVAVLGAVARHRLPLAWLLDEEGPEDGFAAMLRGWTLGPRPEEAEKAARLFGHEPDSPFWEARCPLRDIATFRGRYWRLQAEIDHVQPPPDPPWQHPPAWYTGKSAIRLNNAALDAGLPEVRLNLEPPGRRFTAEAPPRWPPGRMADHPEVVFACIRYLALGDQKSMPSGWRSRAWGGMATTAPSGP